MLETRVSGRRHNPIGEAVWIVAGIIVVMAFGDALIVSALALAIAAMTATWWVHHKASQRVQQNDAQLAPVTQLRARLTHQNSAGARGPRAA